MNSQIILVRNINVDKEYTNVLNYTENQMLALCRANAGYSWGWLGGGAAVGGGFLGALFAGFAAGRQLHGLMISNDKIGAPVWSAVLFVSGRNQSDCLPQQLPEHPAQLPEHFAPSGQPMHLIPFFFARRI